MKNTSRKAAFASLITSFTMVADSAHAHPGNHAEMLENMSVNLFTSPWHFLPILAAVGCLAVALHHRKTIKK